MQWIGFALIASIALAMDCLALSITDGLTYGKIGRGKYFFIAGVFGTLQGVMPLIGFLLGRVFAEWIDQYDHYIAFGLLLFIGGKMIFEGIRGLIKPPAVPEPKAFRYSDVLLQGVADSIDALATGVTIYDIIQLDPPESGIRYEVWIAFGIIALMSFLISLIGLFAGGFFNRLLKGRYDICNLVGGSILVLLGIFLLLEGLDVISFISLC